MRPARIVDKVLILKMVFKNDKVIKNMTMRIVIIKLLNNSSGVSDEFVAEQDSPAGQHLPGC